MGPNPAAGLSQAAVDGVWLHLKAPPGGQRRLARHGAAAAQDLLGFGPLGNPGGRRRRRPRAPSAPSAGPGLGAVAVREAGGLGGRVGVACLLLLLPPQAGGGTAAGGEAGEDGVDAVGRGGVLRRLGVRPRLIEDVQGLGSGTTRGDGFAGPLWCRRLRTPGGGEVQRGAVQMSLETQPRVVVWLQVHGRDVADPAVKPEDRRHQHA